jgi:hypothetical protein
MMQRKIRLVGVGFLAAAACAAVLAVTAIAVRAQDVPPFSGVWKLNVEASTNPNGPSTGPAAGRSGRGGGGGGGIGGGIEGGATARQFDPQPGGDLGPEEMQRFNAMRKLFFQAPPMMGLQATATEFKMILDPAKNIGFAHKTDNKKESLATATGMPADFKVKWDGKKIRREIETKETLHIVEVYELSPDGQQLIVTLKSDSRMVRNVQTSDIKRVYDRQKQ